MRKSKTILFFITALAIFFTSCEEQKINKAPQSKRIELDTLSRYSDQNYKVYTLEGCEYVVVSTGSNRWGSHKGNCKNPIHKQ